MASNQVQIQDDMREIDRILSSFHGREVTREEIYESVKDLIYPELLLIMGLGMCKYTINDNKFRTFDLIFRPDADVIFKCFEECIKYGNKYVLMYIINISYYRIETNATQIFHMLNNAIKLLENKSEYQTKKHQKIKKYLMEVKSTELLEIGIPLFNSLICPLSYHRI